MGAAAIIRPATLADAASIQAIYTPIVADTPISFETDVPSVPEMAARIKTIGARFPYLVAERDGTVIGYAYASTHRARAAYATTVEPTIYVAQAARGQGVGRALYSPMLAALQAADFHSAVAGITLPNPASVALHEAMGFEKVGVFREVGKKFKVFHDVGWWQKLF
ncbi:MAG: arsinothricin resistance N-acetyltransferase ArsN1 family B [Pseudomonadota bacterium]